MGCKRHIVNDLICIILVRAVRFRTPLWQIRTLKRSSGTRTFLQGVDFSSARRPFLPAKDFLRIFHPQGTSVEQYSMGTVLCPVHFLASLIVDIPFSTPLSFS